MTVAGCVLEAPGLGLPGGRDTLALVACARDVFDRIVHEHPAAFGDDPYDLHDMGPELLAACAVNPALTVDEARGLLDEWAAGDAQEVLDRCLGLCLPRPVDRAWWRLERDVRLRAEMDYCAEQGVPHSRFLGGPDVWTEQDRDLVLAWQARRRAACRGCGTRPDQWRDDPQAFDVDAYDCPGCFLLSRARKSLTEKDAAAAEHIHLYLVPADTDDGDGGDG